MRKAEKAKVAQIITALRFDPWTDPTGEQIEANWGPIIAGDYSDFYNSGWDGYADGMLTGLADLETIDPVRDHLRVWALDSRLTDGWLAGAEVA